VSARAESSVRTVVSVSDDRTLDPTTLAARPEPGRDLDRLARQGPHALDDGRWVVARPDDVATVLMSPDARVVPPVAPPAIATLLSRMARFSEGDLHTSRRMAVDALVATLEPAALRDSARDATRRALDGRDEVDAVALARWIPALTLAEAMSLADPDAAVRNVHALLDAIGSAEPVLDGTAVSGLHGLDDAGTAVLFQTVDATAAFIVDRLVESPCASIVLTTRSTSAALAVGGTTIPAGSTILVVLGAAARSDPTSSFGRGPHRCPGSSIATALADGVVEAVQEWSGVRALPSPRQWQDRPNLRLPSELVVRRRPHLEQGPGR
jgi:cytochrome P450